MTLTPSRVLTIVLLGVIATAPFRALFWRAPEVPTGERRVEGNIVDVVDGKLMLDLVEVDDAAFAGKVRVTAPEFPRQAAGDRVVVVCGLERPEPFDGFPYDKFLAIRHVYAVCRTGDIPLLVQEGADQRLTTDLIRLRDRVVRRIDAVLPEPQSTLLAGLLLGSADFAPAWDERFAETGTSHIVAASGTNVAIVVFVLFGLFTWCGVRRQYAVPLLFAGIGAYAVIAGLQPAVVRAAIMGGLVVLAQSIGRRTSMRNVFLLAIAVMVTVQPLLVFADVGFGLSVLSTASLLWLAPRLTQHLQWIPEQFGLREAMVGSLSAGLFTLPLSLAVFGRVSLVSPLVNLLVLPFVPYAMGMGVLAIVGGKILAVPCWGLLTIMLEMIRAIAAV